MKLSFRFTRHGYSCNNINTTLIEKALYSDRDPSLTIWGIIETFKHGKENIDYFNSNNIYVSCLVRTWLTATLLYIHHVNKVNSNNKIILLNIVPFLKEKHLNLLLANDKGNSPEVLNKQINKLILLLKYCFTFLSSDDINLFKDLTIIIKSLDLYNISLNIDDKLNIKTEVNYIKIKKLNNIPGLIKIKDVSFKSYDNYKFDDNNKYINYFKNIKDQKLKSSVNYTKLKINNNILNTSAYNRFKNKTPNYDYHGITFYNYKKNINFFINWYIDNKLKAQYFDIETIYTNNLNSTYESINDDKNNKNKHTRKHKLQTRNLNNYSFKNTTKQMILDNTYDKCIHCVSHNKVMQQFILSLLNKDDKSHIKKNTHFNNIINTNSWSIQINMNNYKFNDIYILNGVYTPSITYYKVKNPPLFISNKDVKAIKQCELLCYRDHIKRNIIFKKSCDKKIKQYTKKYISKSKSISNKKTLKNSK